MYLYVSIDVKELRAAMAFAGHINFQSEAVRVFGRFSTPIEKAAVWSASYRMLLISFNNNICTILSRLNWF